MRVNLSVAIVAMTDDDRPNENVDYFMWKESTQSLVLSSFFWGYVITQIPAGQLVEKFGAKFLLLVALTICATLNICIPLCASYGGWKVTIFKIFIIQLLGNLTLIAASLRYSSPSRSLSRICISINSHTIIKMGSCI